MRNKFISLLLAGTLTLTLAPVSSQAAVIESETDYSHHFALKEGTYEEGEVLVTLAAPEDTALTKEGRVSFDSNMTVENSYEFGDAEVLGTSEKEQQFLEDKTLYVTTVHSNQYSTGELLEELDNQAYVVSVEPNYYFEKMGATSDTLSDSQWSLNGGTSGNFKTTSSGIHYSSTSQYSTGDTPVVAVVDTGVDYNHEDLSSKMWINPHSALPGTYGYDFGDMDSDPMDTDEDSHGTHCAGTIGAAANNNTGIAGITNSVRIMALKVFTSSGKASSSSVVGAFNYIYNANQLGVNVAAVNCSWGGGTTPDAMKTLIKKIGEQGTLFLFASGNDGENQDAKVRKECPYDIDSPYIVMVGSSNLSDGRSDFSDYGAKSVDIFAPGSQILSTVADYTFFPAIYPAAKWAEQTSYFSDCKSADLSLVPSEDIGKNSSGIIFRDVIHSTKDYFNNSGSGTNCIRFASTGGNNSNMLLYLDVTDLNLNPYSSYYIAYDLGMSADGSFDWEHCVVKRSSSYFTEYEGRTYLCIVNLTGNFNSVSELYFDNISISKPDANVSGFGKYNVYSGTSMAAPVVSSAVALLANAYPKDTAVQRKERLFSCVRKVSGLSSACVTGGILDLSKVKTAKATTSSSTTNTSKKKKVSVKKVKLNKKKATLKYKKKLKLKATVTPKNATNKKVKWSVSKKKYATVTQKGVVKAKKKGIGHTVKVYATAKDGSKKKAYCKVKIKKAS